MRSGSSPKLPPKPSHIAKDPVASAEWDRICAALQLLADNQLEIQEYLIADSSTAYAGIAVMKQALADQGRCSDTRPMAEDCDRMVGRYLRYVAEIGVQPGPLVGIHRCE